MIIQLNYQTIVQRNFLFNTNEFMKGDFES